MPLAESVLGFARRVFATQVAHAHCDIPCGIYDPHLAQLAALTTIRMNQLIAGLAVPSHTATPQEQAAYAAAVGRYVAVKEEHAELCKKELRVLWGDYFRPEHVQQHPGIHEQFFNAMKLASKVRQSNDMQAAQDLLKAVQGIAEIFWQTKGAKTTHQPSRQGVVAGELVYPA
ncbi:MAG: superoxide dismutase, Ni [Dehalococcoidia bacterium]|nr:superoxide dismutase, Ni [Dehalococcoidia bacterium]